MLVSSSGVGLIRVKVVRFFRVARNTDKALILSQAFMVTDKKLYRLIACYDHRACFLDDFYPALSAKL